jgi:hypothetical protein
MDSTTASYRGHRFPPEIISHVVWLYCRGTGFVVTAASLVFALTPGKSVADPTFFYITVFGMLALATIVGVGLYVNGKLRRKRAEAAAGDPSE